MKRILSAVILITIVIGSTIAASSAYFSDTETSTNNVFHAGAIDLKIDNHSYYNGVLNPGTTWELNDLTNQLFFNFDDLKPSDWGEDTISLHVNDNDSWACMNVNLTKNDDNTCTGPELIDDPSCVPDNANLFDGELAQNVNFVFWGDDGDNVLEDGEVVFQEGSAQALFNGESWTVADKNKSVWDENGEPLKGGQTYYVGKAWCFGNLTVSPVAQDGHSDQISPTNTTGGIHCDGSGLNNAAQTDIAMADVNFTAVQSRNNSDFVCGQNGGEPTPPPQCIDKADVMLVLDRSGSINSSELSQLKTAAQAFVTALNPSSSGAHIGQVSFSTLASLDTHLTFNTTLINNGINAIISSGFTNLYDAITKSTNELANPGDGHDRTDATSPDYMVVITDGNPNQPPNDANARAQATAAATTAKANGTTIYVVGVGSDVDATYLQNNIASPGAGHYFAAANYAALSSILQGLATACN